MQKRTLINHFHALKKIDAHLHLNTENRGVIETALRHRFLLITVNVEYPEFGSLEMQYQVAQKVFTEYAGVVKFICTFSMENWESPEWLANTLTGIERDMQQGALAVKIWKNIGMDVRDKNGNLLFIDDSRLDPLFNYLEDHGYPVMMHQAEPKNCWLPLEEMTMKYDREYFREHPQYHLYRHRELPSYQQLLDARDRRLRKNPALKTIQAHLGSMEWSVGRISEFLDCFPKSMVDTAARMNHLMLQAQTDWQKVRAFFVKYQDRILYATDFFIMPQNKKTAAQELERMWLRDWEFLSTKHSMRIDEFKGTFNGLELPDSVLSKIYRTNAEQFFKYVQAPVSEDFYA